MGRTRTFAYGQQADAPGAALAPRSLLTARFGASAWNPRRSARTRHVAAARTLAERRATMIPANDIIEGSYRVVSTRDPSSRPFSKSPNRQRAVARIILWNLVLFAGVIYIPIFLG